MRNAILAAAVVLLGGSQGDAGELTVTFIGNEAFHITDGKVALLIRRRAPAEALRELAPTHG